MNLGKEKKSKKLNFEIKNNIYFSVSSEGLGHSSRILAIAREFDKKNVCIGSYNYAYERLANAGYNCFKVPQELKLVGKKGTFDVRRTIIKNHSWALKFNQMVSKEIDLIKKSGASCVVADGRLVPVIASDKLGLPCVALTNQSGFYPFFAQDSALIRVFGRSFDWIMKTWLSSAEEIMIPDFPPPYTVCLPNLSHNLKVMKRTRFTGPLVSWDRNEVECVERPSSPYIVVTLGGHAYRKPLLDTVVETAKILPDIRFDIFTSLETRGLPDNIRVISTVGSLAGYMKSADLIITQAGHSTAMELLTLGKPSLIVPDARQIEQENNASRMYELGVAETLGYDKLDKFEMAHSIKKVLNESKYIDSCENFANMAMDIQGRKIAADVIKDYAARLTKY